MSQGFLEQNGERDNTSNILSSNNQNTSGMSSLASENNVSKGNVMNSIKNIFGSNNNTKNNTTESGPESSSSNTLSSFFSSKSGDSVKLPPMLTDKGIDRVFIEMENINGLFKPVNISFLTKPGGDELKREINKLTIPNIFGVINGVTSNRDGKKTSGFDMNEETRRNFLNNLNGINLDGMGENIKKNSDLIKMYENTITDNASFSTIALVQIISDIGRISEKIQTIPNSSSTDIEKMIQILKLLNNVVNENIPYLTEMNKMEENVESDLDIEVATMVYVRIMIFQKYIHLLVDYLIKNNNPADGFKEENIFGAIIRLVKDGYVITDSVEVKPDRIVVPPEAFSSAANIGNFVDGLNSYRNSFLDATSDSAKKVSETNNKVSEYLKFGDNINPNFFTDFLSRPLISRMLRGGDSESEIVSSPRKTRTRKAKRKRITRKNIDAMVKRDLAKYDDAIKKISSYSENRKLQSAVISNAHPLQTPRI